MVKTLSIPLPRTLRTNFNDYRVNPPGKKKKTKTSSTLATSCKELTHWKRLWCWERLEAGGEGVDRGWDGWTASLTQWTWVWVNSGSWWWTGRPVVLRCMGSQRVRHDWATELNWTDPNMRQSPKTTHYLNFLRRLLIMLLSQYYVK